MTLSHTHRHEENAKVHGGSPQPSRLGASLSADEEIELMARINVRDNMAFHTVVQTYNRMIYGLLYRLTQSQDRAEDLTQEVFLTLWEKSHLWNSTKARLSTWLYTIASNKYKDQQKWRWRLSSLSDDFDVPDTNTPEANAAQTHLKTRVFNALKALKPKEKLVVTLFYYEHKKQKEIADITNMTPKAVERLLAKTRDRLKHDLHDVWHPNTTQPQNTKGENNNDKQ